MPPAVTRRELGAGLGSALVSAALAAPAIAQAAPRVVVIGGGPGGATLARLLRTAEPRLAVTLVEPAEVYTTPFFSSLYLAGLRDLAYLQHGYGGLARAGVAIARDRATGVDLSARLVTTAGGQRLAYDRLVMAPGIEMRFDGIPGYDATVAEAMPHAYAGADQIVGLRRQLEAMRPGGVVVIAAPPNPSRCPPAPYERACMIAHYLQARKPGSKVVILDPKNAFTQQEVFEEAFARHYPGIVELNLSNEIDDFSLARIDPATRTIETRSGMSVRADVASIIPRQRAGAIAIAAGLAEGDWVPVDPVTFRARKATGVYVIGDAAIATEMPRSAVAANSQAGVVAADILAELSGKPRAAPRLHNACWSMLAEGDASKLGANYAPGSGRLVPSEPFLTKRGEPPELRRRTWEEGLAWYDGLVADVFGPPSAR